MTPPIVKRYLIAFDKYKWIGIASFGLVVVGSTVVALQPEPAPTYMANGALTYARPPVSFSTTGTEINLQGQELSEEILLSDQIVESVATKLNISPKKIATSVSLKLPERAKEAADAQQPTTIELRYRDSDRQRARDTLAELMEAMIRLSGEINTRRLNAIITKVNERIPAAKRDLQVAERKLELYDRRERPKNISSRKWQFAQRHY